jgi:hypothetical protein
MKKALLDSKFPCGIVNVSNYTKKCKRGGNDAPNKKAFTTPLEKVVDVLLVNQKVIILITREFACTINHLCFAHSGSTRSFGIRLLAFTHSKAMAGGQNSEKQKDIIIKAIC